MSRKLVWKRLGSDRYRATVDDVEVGLTVYDVDEATAASQYEQRHAGSTGNPSAQVSIATHEGGKISLLDP